MDDDPRLAAGHVRMRRDGAVATVTLDRPQARNAMTPATWQALAAVGERLPPDVRVVVLRGAGPSFSAGLDRALLTPEAIARLTALPADELDAVVADYQEAFTWWRRPDVVTVAAVQGHAVGAGFQLALACDLRVVADDVRFAMRETSLGLVPDLGGTAPLVRAVGYARALEICLTGREVGAAEAVASGLAQLAVPRDQLDAAVADLVAALLAPDADAVRETTALLAGAGQRSDVEQLAAERAAQGRRLRALVEGQAQGRR
jgi:enoyl-CoA hydratase/carnithine racemase